MIIYQQIYQSSFLIGPRMLLRVNFMRKMYRYNYYLLAKLSILICYFF